VRFLDLAKLAGGAILFHRLRSALTMLGITIGIASVILLTSIGEGTRSFVFDQFSQFGTNIIAINPGRSATSGIPGALGITIRKLTIEDAEAIRRIPEIQYLLPICIGAARVEGAGRARNVLVVGANHEVPEVFNFGVWQGTFLPPGDARSGTTVAVLAPKLKRELFGDASALGERVKIGGRRFLVTGVMEPKGELLGFDLDDRVYIPIAQALTLFDRDGLQEIDVRFSLGADPKVVADKIRRVLVERHRGEEDFTVTTQTEMLDVFGRVLGIVSVAVGGIAGISLVVGALGILTMMWIGVNERTSEIGLAMSIGATRRQILALFLGEASLLSTIGGGAGIVAGMGIAKLGQIFLPTLPVETPLVYVLAALAVSLAVGLASGVLPARRAALLDPIEALRAE
jgi:putative ABC transport system permease protein